VTVTVPAPIPYLRPETLADALDALAAFGEGAEPRLVLCGGTDVYPAHATRPIERPVLDISRVDGLRGIAQVPGGGWRIGATTTWMDIAEASVLPAAFDGLRAAARQVGGRQIQNAGTVAGNIVNASPAADGTPNLLALDASVEVASAARGVRLVPLASFLAGYRATILAPAELVTAVVVPAIDDRARSVFEKLGSRAYLVISIVSVAAVAVVREGLVAEARVVVGACSPVPLRLGSLEAALSGVPAERAANVVRAEHLDGLSPIDDVRGPAAYRRDAALTLVRRAVAGVTA
jgi:CO/xanthine dehydrogenase FAD-binding subunit